MSLHDKFILGGLTMWTIGGICILVGFYLLRHPYP